MLVAVLTRTARMWSSTSRPKKRNAASAAGGPPPGPENRPIGQGTPPRAQRRGWEARAPTPGAQNGQPPRPPHGGRQQHHGGQYGLATRSGPSPGTQSPGLAPKPPRNGRQGLFRTQNRPKVPPGATMASQLPWQFNFSCNQLAISVHVDGTELLSTHWGRWAAPGPSAHPPTKEDLTSRGAIPQGFWIMAGETKPACLVDR